MENKIKILPGIPDDDNREYLPEAIKGSDIVVNENGNNSQPYPKNLQEFHGIMGNETEDEWYEYVPQCYDPSRKTPLVLAMHGGLMTGWGQAVYTSWTMVADRDNIIVVFPNAHTRRLWTMEATEVERRVDEQMPDDIKQNLSDNENNPDIKMVFALLEYLKEKYNKGQYLGGSVNWYYGTYNDNQRTADPETLKEYVTLPSYLGWGNEKNLGGWFGKYFFVSSHSENVERAVMILDYLQSEEFSRDIDSGVEGRWTTDDSGKPSLTADTVAMKTDGSRLDEWKASGIGESDLSAMCGLDYYNVASDGGLIDLWYDEDMLDDSMTYAEKDMCSTLGIDIPSDTLKKRVEAGTSIDLGTGINAIQMGLPTTPKNIVRIDSNCEEITMSAIPSLVQAASDEEFEAAKADLIAQLKDAGAEESVEWWTNAWTEAKTTIEGMTK